jgi:hypothetical protein
VHPLAHHRVYEVLLAFAELNVLRDLHVLESRTPIIRTISPGRRSHHVSAGVARFKVTGRALALDDASCAL